MQNDENCRKHFGGVYPSDQIEHIKIKTHLLPQGFIFNYDPSNKPGSHWVAAIINPPGTKHLFFDSFGRPPALTCLKNFLHGKYLFNPVQYQNELTTSCGEWCIFFLCYHLTHQTFDWSEIFDPYFTIKNDKIVTYWVNKMFSSHFETLDKSFLKKQMCKSMKSNSNNSDYPDRKELLLRIAQKTLNSFPENF